MLYQRKTLSTGNNVGPPAPLPAELVGWPDSALANVSAAAPLAAAQLGYAGKGFFPVEEPAPPPQPPSTVLTRTEFLRLFTMAEVILIKQTAKTNELVDYYQYMLDSATTLDLNSQTVQDGVNGLEALNLITAGRAAQVLGNQQPGPVGG
jgi:hypothetical protein